MRYLTAALILLLLTACEGSEASSVTYPGVDGHSVYLPLRGTIHDPTGAATTAGCAGCHPGTTFREFACTGCHTPPKTDPWHVGVTGYVTTAVRSPDCYRCHPQGTGIVPSNHVSYFPIDTPSHPPLCTMCHANAATRADPTTLGCAPCHAGRPGFASAHARVNQYGDIVAVTSAWCVRCHASGQVDRVAAHGLRAGPVGSNTPGPAGPGDGKHGTKCFTCHTMVPPLPYFGGTGPGVPGRPWAQDWTQARCDSCH